MVCHVKTGSVQVFSSVTWVEAVHWSAGGPINSLRGSKPGPSYSLQGFKVGSPPLLRGPVQVLCVVAGILSKLPRIRLSLPKYGRIELTALARQN
jgi:hypothetical protein